MKLIQSVSFLALILCWPACVCSWGDLGHRTTAYLAALYLTPAEVEQLHRLTGFDDISDAAVWADRVGHEERYSYSRHWHYLNAHDRPPGQCTIDVPRDHPARTSDILSAFVNHTALAISTDSTPLQLQEAFRFLIHWIGDVHQPLHAEGLASGGNRIPVKFEGEDTNLHSVWDVLIAQKLRQAGVDHKEAASAWAADLYARDQTPDLVFRYECHDIGKAFSCILGWARESNALVCSSVLRGGLSSVVHQELAGRYYESAKRVVEWRVTSAGRRMAVWLRSILELMEQRNGLLLEHADQQFLGQGNAFRA